MGCSTSRIAGLLADTENDKFGWFDGDNADNTNETAVVNIILGHGRAITGHKKGFVRGLPHLPEPMATTFNLLSIAVLAITAFIPTGCADHHE